MFENINHLTTNTDKNFNNIYFYGIVVDVNDPMGCKRIRVRIKGIDDKKDDSEIPWATSLLPLYIVTNPKKGEMVKIFYPSLVDIMNKREWLGPITTTFTNLNYESARTALSNQDSSDVESPRNYKRNKNVKNSYVNDEDVAFQGRDNTDIIFKEKEVLIRAGKFVYNDNTVYNEKNPAYIQLKYLNDGSLSYSSMVADKVILMTYKGAKKFSTILDENVLKSIIQEAYSASYAEPLIEFLKLLQNFVGNHIHPQNLPPNVSYGKITEILNFNLDKIIAKNIKIN